MLPKHAVYQLICMPGEYLFIGGRDEDSLVLATVEADRIYDIFVDKGTGWIPVAIGLGYGPTLVPLAKGDPRRARLAEFESSKEQYIPEREMHSIPTGRLRTRIQQIKEKLASGTLTTRVHVLNKEDCR